MLDYHILLSLVRTWSPCFASSTVAHVMDVRGHAVAGRWQQLISHLNWKCCESNLWPSPSSNVGFLARYKKRYIFDVYVKKTKNEIKPVNTLRCFCAIRQWSENNRSACKETRRLENKTKQQQQTQSKVMRPRHSVTGTVWVRLCVCVQLLFQVGQLERTVRRVCVKHVRSVHVGKGVRMRLNLSNASAFARSLIHMHAHAECHVS